MSRRETTPTAVARYSITAMFMLFASQSALAGSGEPTADPSARNAVLGHIVRLQGHGGDNEQLRDELRMLHKGCVERNRILGRPSAPLPPEGVPRIPYPFKLDIYYTASTTLSDGRGTTHVVEDDCRLRPSPHHNREIHSGSGRCVIDMLKREARGECDGEAHLRGPAAFVPPKELPLPSEADLAKLPMPRRAEVIALVKATRQRASELLGTTSASAAEAKTILGHRCQVERLPALRHELCIANPDSPFVPPVSPFHLNQPGLLLEFLSPVYTLRAFEIELSRPMPRELFDVPAGFSRRP